MNDSLAWRLREPYPRIFAARSGEYFSVDCGDGWSDLITALCRSLQYAAGNGSPKPVAFQVKEKLGGLRFYAEPCGRYQEGMIDLASFLSGSQCGICGNSIGSTGRTGRCTEHKAV